MKKFPLIALACFILILTMSKLSFALEEQELTEEQKAELEALWEPLAVTGTAIPWKVFAETAAVEECKTDKDGYDNCVVKPEYSESIQALSGTEVTIMGFMFPLDQTEEQKNFLVGPFPLSCPFHYHIGPTQVIEVFSAEGVEFSYEPVSLKGTLSTKFNEETGVFYYLENARQQ